MMTIASSALFPRPSSAAVNGADAGGRLAALRFRAVFVVLALLIVAYVTWLLVRSPFRYSPTLNGWLPDAFEFVVAGMCVARGVRDRGERLFPILLGAGLFSWALGDTVWTAQVAFGWGGPSDTLGAICWLGFYPLAYLAIIRVVRRDTIALNAFRVTDGLIAALGAAAVCAAFAFHGSGYSESTTTLVEITNLAYPLGDVLLLSLVVVGTAFVADRKAAWWMFLAAGCALNCIGDTINLFQPTEGHYRADAVFHVLAWPSAGLCMCVAIWLRPRIAARHAEPGDSFVLTTFAAIAAIAVLVFGSGHHLDSAARWLAIASIAVAAVRLMWSAHSFSRLTRQHRSRSLTDELTGLGNRRHLFEWLEQELVSSVEIVGSPLAFLYIDLDRFKSVNDSFGHVAGDELLRQLGPRIRGVLHEADLLVRLGGDEFAAVLLGADMARASAVAECVTSAVSEPFVLGGVSASISASVGVAMAPRDGTDADSLMRNADIAMYQAKASGAAVAFYEHRADEDRWALTEDLRQAIERDELVVRYQPQVAIKSGQLVGCEALVRWQHPVRGVVQPVAFLFLAEQGGLMPRLTRSVIDRALRDAAAWRAEGYDLPVSVNVSASNLAEEALVADVAAALASHGVPAASLVLEITETSVMERFEVCRGTLQRLRELGVGVSVDDFGAGFTALSFLSELPANELKLDQKLVRRLADDRNVRDRALVGSTISLAHSLELRVVAEGVEDAATLQVLRELGADVAQGYFIGVPGSFEALCAVAQRAALASAPGA